MTIAIPILNQSLLMQLRDEYPEKRIMVYVDTQDALEGMPQGIYFAVMLNQSNGWAAFREHCLMNNDQMQGLATFKERLRQAMRSAM